MNSASNPQRRKLTFASLDEAVADAENLLAKGYDRLGNWDLAQVCHHLADWMRFPVEGFPRMPVFLRPLFWLFRVTVGPAKRLKYIAEGMPSGKPTMPQTVADAGKDATAAVAKLKEAVARFQGYTGPIHPSPLFGKMNKNEAQQLQLVHCAHHLSFLVPKA